MLVAPFSIIDHNSHYEGVYNDRERRWKEICAIEKVANLLGLLPEVPLSNVLEVGCGDGAVLARLATSKKFDDLFGIDIIDPNLQPQPNLQNFNLSQYDGERIPFDDNTFDLVYATHVIEHVPEPRRLLKEIKRVAKKLVYIEVPCEIHFRTSHQALQNTLNIGHINSFTPETFAILLQTANFKLVEMRAFDHDFSVHSFHTSSVKAAIKMALRQAVLKISPTLATKVFTFHCGALCKA